MRDEQIAVTTSPVIFQPSVTIRLEVCTFEPKSPEKLWKMLASSGVSGDLSPLQRAFPVVQASPFRAVFNLPAFVDFSPFSAHLDNASLVHGLNQAGEFAQVRDIGV